MDARLYDTTQATVSGAPAHSSCSWTARGLRLPARPGGHHQGLAADVRAGRRGGGSTARWRCLLIFGQAQGVRGPSRRGDPAGAGPRSTHGLQGRSAPPSRRRTGEQSMVPEAKFTSYYGRPVVKPSPWEVDIPAYLFAGGLAAGSSLLAAGADPDRPPCPSSGRAAGGDQRANVRLRGARPRPRPSGAFPRHASHGQAHVAHVGGHLDPVRLRPLAAVAAGAELVTLVPGDRKPATLRLLAAAGRPAGLAAALVAPAVAAYTAVLLADTATPSWHEAYRELPLVFVGSAAAASGGFGMLASPLAQAGPARRMALGGAVVELVAEHMMEGSMGITAEPLHEGKAGRLMRAAEALTLGGAMGSLLAAQQAVAGASRASRCWPVRRAPGSASSRQGSSPHVTRSTPSYLSVSASSAARTPATPPPPERSRQQTEGRTDYVERRTGRHGSRCHDR